MHNAFVTLACFAAALVAGTAPARAQALPVYDVDAETAKCMTQAETGKQWTDALKNWCQSIGKDEHLAHDQLAERWESYDKGKRTSCVADKGIADYSSLKKCLRRNGTIAGPEPGKGSDGGGSKPEGLLGCDQGR